MRRRPVVKVVSYWVGTNNIEGKHVVDRFLGQIISHVFYSKLTAIAIDQQRVTSSDARLRTNRKCFEQRGEKARGLPAFLIGALSELRP